MMNDASRPSTTGARNTTLCMSKQAAWEKYSGEG
jgi:hypothetical protein